MIAHLRGTLLEKHPGLVVVDVGGVGYEVTVPLPTYRSLGDAASTVELHVHTHVREETLALFGFATRREKELFVVLLGVNGIGPKTAVAVLSGLGVDELVETVRRRDAGRLAAVPGVGRKTAERIILEVSDRIADSGPGARAGGGDGPGGLRSDLVSALLNLGYNARTAADAAAHALEDASETPPKFEALLRRALKGLAR